MFFLPTRSFIIVKSEGVRGVCALWPDVEQVIGPPSYISLAMPGFHPEQCISYVLETQPPSRMRILP